MLMARHNEGLGSLIREEWASGKEAPNPQQQMTMFYIGIVMDDVDEQRLGRVWVKINSKSSAIFQNSGDRKNSPIYGGTTPDRDNETRSLNWKQQLRQGWIHCTPMFPVFGADDYRTIASTDGDNRNSQDGNVQAYGFWAQPRIGDSVGILFADGDPSKAYWIGCAPKFDRNFMVPGASGRPKEDLASKQRVGNPVHPVTKQFKDNSPDDALIPALDKTRGIIKNSSNEAPAGNENQDAEKIQLERELTNVLIQREFSENLREAGLLCDPVRGASSSS